MKRISKANIKKSNHPLTEGERMKYLMNKNNVLQTLINEFDLETDLQPKK